MEKHKVSYSIYVKVVTIIFFGFIFISFLTAIRSFESHTVSLSLITIIIGLTIILSPEKVIVSHQKIWVKSILGITLTQVSIHNISSIANCNIIPTQTFKTHGVMGHLGKCMDGTLSLTCDRSKSILIRKKEGSPILISVQNPNLFIDTIQSKLK